MDLFVEALDKELTELHAKGVRVRFIGARRNLSVRLQTRIAAAEERTGANERLNLQLAVSYGGRWDLVQAAPTGYSTVVAPNAPCAAISPKLDSPGKNATWA